MSSVELQYVTILDRLSALRRREPFVREVEETGRLIVECTERRDSAERHRLAMRASHAVDEAASRAAGAGSRDAGELRDIRHMIGLAARQTPG